MSVHMFLSYLLVQQSNHWIPNHRPCINFYETNSNNRPKSTNPRFCKKDKENLYHAGGHARQTHTDTSTHLHLGVTCALTHYFNIRVLGRWSMPFCQGGCLFTGRQTSLTKAAQIWQKSILWNRNPLMNELLLKMCHSKINKTLTGQRWMVLYSTNPWWTHTSWNFTHFGWYLKTGPISSSKILHTKYENLIDTIPPKICFQPKHALHRMMEFYCQPGWKCSSWKWPGKRFHDDVQLHIDCK